MTRVKFDVGGTTFSIERSLLDSGPGSKLTRMCSVEENSNKDGVFFMDRPAESFGAILALYQTGNLCIPVTSCPGAFLKEMEFWEIEPRFLSTCCFYRLEQYKEERRRLEKFHKQIISPYQEGPGLLPNSPLDSLRAQIWSLIEFKGQSLLNKLYFALACIMILLSILAVSFGTCEMFRRNMTNCERLEYMKATKMEHFRLFAALIERHDCDNTMIPDFTNGSPVMSSGYHDYDMYDVDYESVFVPDPDKVSDITAKSIPYSHWMTIRVPDMKIPVRAIVVLDILTLIFFSVDFALRLLSCPSLLSYFKSVINIADGLALIGSYIYLIIIHVHKDQRYLDNWVDVFALMLMLRSVRLFRIVRTLTAARVLMFTLIQNLKELVIVLLFLVVAICFYSSILYVIERTDEYYRSLFDNVPEGWYWAIITMTTVGYGDIYPVTILGKIIACCCAVTGVIMFALTIPIFATQFLYLYRYANVRCFSVDNCTDDKKESANQPGVSMSGIVLSSPENGSNPATSGHVVEQHRALYPQNI